jgi:hypothetical protein
MMGRKPTAKSTRNFSDAKPLAVTAVVAGHKPKDYEQRILDVVEKIEPGCDLEPIASAYGLLQALKDLRERLATLVDEAVAEKINTDGPFILGEEKFYVGPDTKVKCRDVSAVHEKLLEVAEGDVTAVLACLSANAWKHGSVRRLLEERLPDGVDAEVAYVNLFETTTVDEVKTGKPTKKDVGLRRIPVQVLARLQQRK